MTAGVFAAKADAAKLYFDPSSKTTLQNTDFQINILVDTEDVSAFGADATISFPASDLAVKSVSNGGFFSDFSYSQSSGKLEIHGFFSTLYQAKNGTGTLANIVFTPAKNAGSDNVTFVCTGTGSDTEILSSTGDNILSCSSLNTLNLTYSTTESSSSTQNTSNSDSSSTSSNNSTNSCGGTCGSNYNCNSGLFCYSGFCRNPSCPNISNCDCSVKATVKPSTKPTPTIKSKSTPQVVVLAEATPYPSTTPEGSASPQNVTQNENKTVDTKMLLILAAAVIVGVTLIIVLIKKTTKKRNSQPPQNTPPTYQVPPPLNTPPPNMPVV